MKYLRITQFAISIFLGSLSLSAEEPQLELRAGENFFRIDGRPGFVFGRNPVGKNLDAYDKHFASAGTFGERLARIHFQYMQPGEKAGEIHPDRIKYLDYIFESAAKKGLVVIPVLDAWSNWNDGGNGEIWSAWKDNPFNVVNGGPAKKPSELFEETECRRLYFERIKYFVKRWSKHKNIVAWELFSEVNLISGSTEFKVVDFAERLSKLVRNEDSMNRPITISLASNNEWPALSRSKAIDILQIHPYSGTDGNLDGLILKEVRRCIKAYEKPVLIGECGLDWRPPRNTNEAAPNAKIGIRHAVWASMVSGAMSGRMLWWQDGYDVFENADLTRHYDEISATAVSFVAGVDYTGFAPVECTPSQNLSGAMLGDKDMILGWFRDSKCTAPEWTSRVIRDAKIDIATEETNWKILFFDPEAGKTIQVEGISSNKGKLVVNFPNFERSIAFKLSISPKD